MFANVPLLRLLFLPLFCLLIPSSLPFPVSSSSSELYFYYFCESMLRVLNNEQIEQKNRRAFWWSGLN